MSELFENLSNSWTAASERNFVTPLNELKNFLFYVQEVGVFSTYPNYSAERMGLNSFLILHTAGGTGNLLYGGRTYVLNAGDVFFIDCTEKHKYFNAGGENWEFEWVHFNGPNAQACFHYFLAQNQGVAARTQSDSVRRLLLRLNRINKAPSAQADILSFRILSQIISELFLLKAAPAYTKNEIPEVILDVLNEIDRSFCSRLSLESLAKKFSVNPYVLSRNFKKYVGLGLKTYIIQKRISYAKELLRFTDKPVSEIAETLCYENDEHFIALFKSYEHLTPLSFRKKWQSNQNR